VRTDDLPGGPEAPRSGTDRLTLLTRQVGAALGGGGIRLRAWRAGVDFWADLAYADDALLGVVRSPRYESLATAYEGTVDFGAVVEKEVAVLALLAEHGVPVPPVRAWRRRRVPDELSWMLYDHVPHEPVETLTPPLQKQLGAIARDIHAISTDDPSLVPDRPWPNYVAERLRTRLTSAVKYCPDLLLDEVLAVAVPLLVSRSAVDLALLHMDLRTPNICVRDGRIVAVLDVANAIAGDPLLELARIRSYGLLTTEFRAGYGLSAEALHDFASVLDVYELDTAALLTVVAVKEIDDEALLARSRGRVRELSAALLRRPRREWK
jgi:aminoglycoside phosphotransferase (APT) family kinase protein